MSNTVNTVKNITNGSSLISSASSMYQDETNSNDLKVIGKPSIFDTTIDPNFRIGRYLRNKMNIIDLLPCRFSIPLNKNSEEAKSVSGYKPSIMYDKEMQDYSARCALYGLDPCKGLRILTTDDTSATDSISSSLKENFFQDKASKLTDVGQSIDSISQSSGLSGRKNEAIDQGTDAVMAASEGKTNVAKAAVDTVAKGHRVSLPSIWENSTYQPNFTANINLVSPYGHYKAITEFIIKPLTYLLILSAPQSSDGMTYGKPHFLTLHSYGMNYMPLGIISNISMRRGGNDTGFNIYKQPLSINITLSFKYAVEGFASMSPNPKFSDSTVRSSNQMADQKKVASNVTIPMVGHIIESLRPHNPSFNVNDYAHAREDKSCYGKTLDNESTSFSSGGGQSTSFSAPISPSSINQSLKESSLYSSNETIENTFSTGLNNGSKISGGFE